MESITQSFILPSNFEDFTIEEKDLILQYLNTLSILQLKAYSVANDHLGSSFNILKSIGYLNWKKNN